MNPAILKDIALFVLDMDGTIYLGERPFPAAIEFIRKAKASGRRIVYFTNNASKNPAVYYEKLLRLGFSAEREEIVTAGDVTAEYLQTYHKGAKVYLVGTPFLEASFREKGIFLTDGREADIVVSSFDTTLTYEKLEKACTLIRNGARFYSTHPDFNCPTETGFIPDSGASADHRLDGRAAPLFRQAAQGNGGDDHAPLRRAVRADGGRRRPALHRHRARPQQRADEHPRPHRRDQTRGRQRRQRARFHL